MSWNSYSWTIKSCDSTRLLDALCDYGVDPNYIQLIPNKDITIVSIECTEERYSYLMNKKVFEIGKL